MPVIKGIAKRLGAKKLRTEQIKKQRIAKAVGLGVPPDRIGFLDHHLCHAASAYHGWGKYDDRILVLTNDGAGDDLCATVSIGQAGRLERIAAVPMDHSIGELWALFTATMGMVPLEHEYKLMGLAPYAPPEGVERPVLQEDVDRLAERCRAGGAGIPGFYTKTGVGTLVAEGKEHREFNGETYILETGLVADLSIVKAQLADTQGNLVFNKTARNFNPPMAMAGKVTVAEVEEIVPTGDLDPDHIHLPGIFVQRIIKGTFEKRIEQRTVRKRETH